MQKKVQEINEILFNNKSARIQNGFSNENAKHVIEIAQNNISEENYLDSIEIVNLYTKRKNRSNRIMLQKIKQGITKPFEFATNLN